MVSEIKKLTNNICLLLPRTVIEWQIANAAQHNKIKVYEIESALVANIHKFNMVYFGELVQEFE